MSRINFDHDTKIVNDFKKLLNLRDDTCAVILRPHVEAYVNEHKHELEKLKL